ncbi:MAG: TolC family protein, partial [Candidatus Omnitrophota bacterium]|nr:TolC family protein [Candidatus Omnitrophota bacterium]
SKAEEILKAKKAILDEAQAGFDVAYAQWIQQGANPTAKDAIVGPAQARRDQAVIEYTDAIKAVKMARAYLNIELNQDPATPISVIGNTIDQLETAYRHALAITGALGNPELAQTQAEIALAESYRKIYEDWRNTIKVVFTLSTSTNLSIKGSIVASAVIYDGQRGSNLKLADINIEIKKTEELAAIRAIIKGVEGLRAQKEASASMAPTRAEELQKAKAALIETKIKLDNGLATLDEYFKALDRYNSAWSEEITANAGMSVAQILIDGRGEVPGMAEATSGEPVTDLDGHLSEAVEKAFEASPELRIAMLKMEDAKTRKDAAGKDMQVQAGIGLEWLDILKGVDDVDLFGFLSVSLYDALKGLFGESKADELQKAAHQKVYDAEEAKLNAGKG